jgi:type IV pilus assembly protein PilN
MVRINLLSVRVSKKKEAGKQQLLLFVVLLVAGLVGNVLWASGRAGELKTRQTKLTRTKTEIAQLDRIIGEVADIKEAQRALKEKLDTLEKLKAGRSGPVRMLDDLATITPKRLWLAKMEQKGAVVTFTGFGATIDDVSAFMSALDHSTFFSTVELNKTAAKVENGRHRLVDFTITATVDYAPAPPATAEAPAAGSNQQG